MTVQTPIPGHADLPTPASLLRQAKAGRLEAFERLVNLYERKIFNLARRITANQQDAEDVTQQTFLNALEHLADFREESSFETWVSRIATYGALKILRKRRGLPTVSLEENVEPDQASGRIPHPEFIADWRNSPERILENRETARLIEEALATLDAKHRVVFLLRDVEGFSVKETAAALGLTEANVKVRLLRARLVLREILTRQLGDPRRRVNPVHAHE